MSEKQPQEPEQPDGRAAQSPWDPNEEFGDIYRDESSDSGHVERAEKVAGTPRIWVGSLADYNNGRLHGEWIEASAPDEELRAAVQRILDASEEPGAEEYGIFDYENFGQYKVHEYDRLEQVARVARGVAQHGPAFAAWAELHDADPTMLDQFEDAYLGEYETPAEWAREVLHEGGLDEAIDRAVPEPLRAYLQIDYVGWVRDAHLAGDIHIEWKHDGGVWVYAVM